MQYKLEEPFGPNYNIDSPELRKFRRRGHNDRKAYGQAVLAAVLRAQAAQLRRAGEVMPKPACESGTDFSDGKAILASIARRQHAALAACAAKIRRDRTPEEWQELYAEAIKAKRTPKHDQAKTRRVNRRAHASKAESRCRSIKTNGSMNA